MLEREVDDEVGRRMGAVVFEEIGNEDAPSEVMVALLLAPAVRIVSDLEGVHLVGIGPSSYP